MFLSLLQITINKYYGYSYREYFTAGLDVVVKRLKPIAIIVYGSAPDYIFSTYKEQGIKVYQFDSSFATSHKKVV